MPENFKVCVKHGVCLVPEGCISAEDRKTAGSGRSPSYPECKAHRKTVYTWADGTPTCNRPQTYDSTRRKEKAEAKPKPGGSRRAKAESKNQPISENDRESEVEEDNPGYDVSPGGVQSIPTALPTVEAEVEEHSLFELPPGDIQGIQPEFYCSSREALSALYPFSMEKEEELVPYVFDPPIVSLQQVEVEPEFTLSLEEQDAICRWFDFDAYYSDIPLAAAPLPPLTVPASGGVQSDAPLAVCVGTKRALEDAEDMSTLSKRRVPKETQES